MAFDSSSQKGFRYLGEGFRTEPDFRGQASGSGGYVKDATTSFGAVTQAAETASETAVGVTRRIPNLEHVFDDPSEGEPGQDRMLVHGIWELLLAVALVGLAYLLYRRQPAIFGTGLRDLLLEVTSLGLVTVAAAVALRAGVPSLSVGAVAVAAGLFYGNYPGDGLLVSLLVVLGLSAAVGAAQGLLVVSVHVPSWAASLGVAMALGVWSAEQDTVTLLGTYNPAAHAYWWFAGLCALSVVAGLIGVIPSVRRQFGRFRPVADPARRRGGVAALIALGATVVSSMLAGLGGVVLAMADRVARPDDGTVLTALAIGAALLGGTSAFGRRGGIFGTILAVALLTVAVRFAAATEHTWPVALVAAVAIVIGLAVTRLVEFFGRPAQRDDDDDWVPKVGSAWTTKPAASTSGVGGLWASDEAWGATDGR